MKALRFGISFMLLIAFFVATLPESYAAEAQSKSQQAAQIALKEAWDQHEDEEYHRAITNLLQLMARYPLTRASVEARYLLGRCYQAVDGYKDAMNLYRDYITLAPEGDYAPDARNRMLQLSVIYEKRFPSQKRTKEQLDAVEEALDENPESVSLMIDRAQHLWMLGRYDEAGEQYMDIAELDPSFKSTQLFTQRIELDDEGTPTVLTPKLLEERTAARDPIIVRNVNGIKTGRERFSKRRRFYTVTGEVVNRSKETHHGVEVFATVYGFGNVVWDTESENIGRLYPGESRAFSFRFGNLRNIDDVNRHEIGVTFLR